MEILAWSYLVSGSNVLLLPVNVDPLSNVWTLLLQSHQNITCLIIETYQEDKTHEAEVNREESLAFQR